MVTTNNDLSRKLLTKWHRVVSIHSKKEEAKSVTFTNIIQEKVTSWRKIVPTDE